MPITDAQREVLAKQDDQTLAEWYCELNSWRWPEALPDKEDPPEFAHAFNNGQEVRWSVMQHIEQRVGKRFLLRVHNRDMSDEVFESFWRGERGPGTPYGEYSKKKVDAQMAARRVRTDRIIASNIVLEDILDAEYIDED